jgi:hypothetical protein
MTARRSTVGDTGRPASGGVPATQMRVSTAERNEVAEELSEQYAQGRLDQAEFNERLERAMAATTRGDLAGLLDDLPGSAPEPLEATPPSRHRHPRTVALVVLVVVAVSVLSALPGQLHVPWFLILVVAWLYANGRFGSHRHHRHRHAEDGSAAPPW